MTVENANQYNNQKYQYRIKKMPVNTEINLTIKKIPMES